jgi:DNA polymerase
MAHYGLNGFDCSKEALSIIENWDKVHRVPSSREGDGDGGGGSDYTGEGLVRQNLDLEAIAADLGDCRRCRLQKHRHRIVFGAGDPKAKLVFVGEGPGFDEDRQGQPFVGAAGQLLTRIIEAMQLSRESVYICNIIKCRPPNNRTPRPDEIQTCFPILERQLAAIAPRVICALGSVAARSLLSTETSISRLRGRFHDYHGIAVMPTFHPAYLLRNPAKKRAVWEDVQQIMKVLDGTEPCL